MTRRGDRELATEIVVPQPPGTPGDAEALARRVDRTLTTSVRLDVTVPAVTRVRHVDLQQLAALEVRGGPMQLRNDLCTPGSVFVYALAEGDCTVRCEAGSVRLVSGQLTLLRGDRTVHAAHAAPFHLLGARLPAAQLERELAGWSAGELLPIDFATGPGRLVFQLQEALLAAGAELTNRSADAYAGLLACVLADALRRALPAGDADGIESRSQAEHHKRRIRAHVRQHLADPQLDVARIGAGVALSIGHLHRLFADEPLSLAAWIQAERLDACHAALMAGIDRGTTLTALAMAWGFRDPAHFSRSFGRRFGITPSALRRQVVAGRAGVRAGTRDA